MVRYGMENINYVACETLPSAAGSRRPKYAKAYWVQQRQPPDKEQRERQGSDEKINFGAHLALHVVDKYDLAQRRASVGDSALDFVYIY